MYIFSHWSPGEGSSLFLLFLQEIISGGRSFSAGILERRRRSEQRNSEIAAYSGTSRPMVNINAGITTSEHE
jgi:hypothetical protein